MTINLDGANDDKHYRQKFWSCSLTDLLQHFNVKQDKGLTGREASLRLTKYGKNHLEAKKEKDSLLLLINQFKSPIILIFIFTSMLSLFLGQIEDALIIVTIVIISGILGFWQEKGATDAINRLLDLVQLKTRVMREGQVKEINSEDIVPGDIILLQSGDNIPADSIIVESKDLFVNEGTLTGESYPAEKFVKVLPKDTPIREITNSVFMGTYVISGTAKALVIKTGPNTELGKISGRLKLKSPETEFERGIRRFGYFLMEITLILVMSILVINVYLGRPVLESFLFSLALAIGLTPQLLPAIISVNLAHGAKRMAKEKVIVKRLAAIENIGSMNILCSDKTGTLTTGEVKLHSTIDIKGNTNNTKVLLYSYLNAVYESGFTNPIDTAIKDFCFDKLDISSYSKMDEIPYDFIRKRLSILVSSSPSSSSPTNKNNKSFYMVTKGAVHNILQICSSAEMPDGKTVDLLTVKQGVLQKFEEICNNGFRVLGICYRKMEFDRTQ